MSEIDRKFDYTPEAGALKLLGVLSIVLAPLLFWSTFQDAGPGNNDMWLIGKGWFFHASGPIVPWIARGMSLVLVWAGYAMVRGGGEEKRYGGRIEFTRTGFIFEAGKPQGTANQIPYSSITDVRVHERRGRGYLTYWHDGTKYIIESKRMRSLLDFEEMAKMLQERVAGIDEKAHAPA